MRRAKSTGTLIYRASRARESGRPAPRGLTRVPWLALLAAGICVALPAAVGAVLPAEASAGLPDGRIYEQVSPALKSGTQAGAQIVESLGSERHTNSFLGYSIARADGNALLFWGSGPIGEASAGYSNYFVAERATAGWTTRSATPRTLEPLTDLGVSVDWLTPSADFSHVAFTSPGYQYVPAQDGLCSSNAFETGTEPLRMPTWIAQPQIANPAVACGANDLVIVGGTPNFGTIYYGYAGTLLPEDASRIGGAGFYEYREGSVSEAGVLPDGSLDPCGAVPSVFGHGGAGELGTAASANSGNGVSENGSRAFFLSPDPGLSECTSRPPEAYVRETAPDGSQSTELVSEDPLLPKVNGLPAPAPHGTSFIYASPDGSHAFFQSTDQLTSEAPNDTKLKTYDFNVESDSLRYLPEVVGSIVASAQDGSSFTFENTATSPTELERWSSGQNGETVTQVAHCCWGYRPQGCLLTGP